MTTRPLSGSKVQNANGPTIDDVLKRLEAITNPSNLTKARQYVLEKQHDVALSTLQSRLDAIIPLACHLGDRAWSDTKREDIIETIATHRFVKGQHLRRDGQGPQPRPLAPSTMYQWKVHIRTFLKWAVGRQAATEICHELPFAKRNSSRQRARELALQPVEVRALLAGAQSTRDRCIVLFLLETGFRASEAAAVRIVDVEARNNGYWVRLPAGAPNLKTGPRDVDVPVIAGAPTLGQWLDEHPRRHDGYAPLFVTMASRSTGNPMTGKTLGEVVKRCGTRAGIRPVHAHMLRHTSATLKLAKGMEPEVVRLLHGWSERSNMLSHYADLRGHFEALVLQAHGLKSETPELTDLLGGQACPVCGAGTGVCANDCPSCGASLATGVIAAQEQRQRDHVVAFAMERGLSSLQPILFIALATLLQTARQEGSA